MLLLQVRVDLRAMAIKEYSTFPKPLGLEPHHQIVLVSHPGHLLKWGGLTHSAEMQSVYSKAADDWAENILEESQRV